jgi:hypothetical protein
MSMAGISWSGTCRHSQSSAAARRLRWSAAAAVASYSDGKVANHEIRIRHLVIENGY